MAKRGRKPKPEEERKRIIDHVLGELSAGRSIARIFREDSDSHNLGEQSTFWRWHFDDEDLRGKVAHARENGVESIVDETLEIADDGTNDWRPRRSGDGEDDGNTMLDHEHVQRSKLRIETRIKYAQMIAPRKYGPKLDLTSGGEKLGLAAEIEAARKRAADGAE